MEEPSAQSGVVRQRPWKSISGDAEVRVRTAFGQRFKPHSFSQDENVLRIAEAGQRATSTTFDLSAVVVLSLPAVASLNPSPGIGDPDDTKIVLRWSDQKLVLRITDPHKLKSWASILLSWVSFLRQVPMQELEKTRKRTGRVARVPDMDAASWGAKKFLENWERLYFRLAGRTLRFYRDSGDSSPLGYLETSNIKSVSAGGQEDGWFLLEISVRGASEWLLGFETAFIRDEWRNRLVQGTRGLGTVSRAVGRFLQTSSSNVANRRGGTVSDIGGASYAASPTRSMSPAEYTSASPDADEVPEPELARASTSSVSMVVPDADQRIFDTYDFHEDNNDDLPEFVAVPPMKSSPVNKRTAAVASWTTRRASDSAIEARVRAAMNNNASSVAEEEDAPSDHVDACTQLQEILAVYDGSSSNDRGEDETEGITEDCISISTTLQELLEHGSHDRESVYAFRAALANSHADPRQLRSAVRLTISEQVKRLERKSARGVEPTEKVGIVLRLKEEIDLLAGSEPSGMSYADTSVSALSMMDTPQMSSSEDDVELMDYGNMINLPPLPAEIPPDGNARTNYFRLQNAIKNREKARQMLGEEAPPAQLKLSPRVLQRGGWKKSETPSSLRSGGTTPLSGSVDQIAPSSPPRGFLSRSADHVVQQNAAASPGNATLPLPPAIPPKPKIKMPRKPVARASSDNNAAPTAEQQDDNLIY